MASDPDASFTQALGLDFAAGFVRGALRALTRERHARGIGPDKPFDLIARVDGRVTLMDPTTGQRVDLESFGPTNTAEFSRFLAMQPE